MNFSEVFKLSGLLCKFSPDGKYLASCVQYRLVVRDVHTLQILHLYTCLDQIQHIEWSADSLFILCAMYKRGQVQVWSLEQPEWHCRIDEGSAGLVASCWGPGASHILNTTEFHLRITVWSLCTKSVSYIKYPKACQQGEARGVPIPESQQCLVCSCGSRSHFDTETQDLAGIEWAPNGCVLAVWDTCLEYKVLLYSLDGRLLSAYCAYEWSLGVKSVAWSPSSQFLAIGSYDGKVRILNHVTWKMITEFGHPATISNPKIWCPCPALPTPQMGHSQVCSCPRGRGQRPLPFRVLDEIASVPVSLQTLKPVADRANPKIGIGALAFSPDSYFLATRSDSVPNAVWIWDIQKLRLFVVLEQLSPVRSFQWDPQQPRLAICTGGGKVYLWSPAGCVSVQVPGEGDFQVLSLCWHLNGDSLALLSKDHFCLCFLETEDGVGTAFGRPGDHT
uniref:WD repeat containing, antisense to TP73 n=1 Tax=Panthera tigris altaica TaxID=74533 RepID=A0A8C9M774_PANTA